MPSYTNKETFKKEVKGYVQKSKGSHFSAGSSPPIDGGRQEMKEEAFISRLNKAVEEGRITQEQADEIIKWWELRPDDAIREWWELKPEVIKPGMVEHALRFRVMPRIHM